MMNRSFPHALLAVWLTVLAPHAAADDGATSAAASTTTTLSSSEKNEARRRFDRGLALYNQGDLSGALAEFRLAYKLTSHPVVLYNLALVQAAMGQAAEAVAALEKLQSPAQLAELGPQRAERARQVYEEQLLRVGTLEIRSNVPRAQVQIDSLDVARTPAGPIRVTAGTHIVALSAAQHEPRRVSVTVAGRALEVLEVPLVPLDQALAHFMPSSSVPEVEVRANGELLGKTPFASNLALRPGSYELEFTRSGYVPVRRRVELDPGSAGRLDVKMVPSDGGLAAGGLLDLRLSESDTVINVDGEPRLDHSRGLRLPVGRHHLRIQRAGFHDVEREVWVRPGRQSLEVALLPTPAYLDDYVRSAKTQRMWGFVALGSGALLAGGSAGFLLWNQSQKSDAERDFDAYADMIAQSPGGECPDDDCERQLGILVDELDARRQRDVFGWVGLSVGAVALGTGVFLLARAPDPARYEPKPESDVFGRLELRLQPNGLRLSGIF
jgi:hypothetical protein